MFDKIYEKIKNNDVIVIARHIGVDPDALGSQFALKLSIEGTFKNKKVYAVGSKSSKYTYFPKLDKYEHIGEDCLLIVTDTPDKKRIDIANLETYNDICKIDHHPFIDKFGECEYINPSASSASELVYEFIKHNNMYMDKEVAKNIFLGIVSDTNRFLFNTTTHTLEIIKNLIDEFNIDMVTLYNDLYKRSLLEIRLQGYISTNMKVTENGLGFVIITDDIIKQYGVDASTAGNMINNFNNIEEVYVWVAVSEDTKNNVIKFNIRSRGPIINEIAEKYNGGGHKYASGAKVSDMETAQKLLNDLDEACREFLKEEEYHDEV